jgi:hypothetical protein
VPLSTNAGVLQTRHRAKSLNNYRGHCQIARRSPFRLALSLCSAEKRQRPRKRHKLMRGLECGHGASCRRRSSGCPAEFIHSHQGAPTAGPKGDCSHVNHPRPAGDTLWRTCLHPMMERHMLTSESSYFNFLMKNRGVRRTPVPFAQAVGVLPELARAVRCRRPAPQPKAAT